MEDISVIIPTYNHAAYVVSCLESVSAQTVRPFEIIVVNDGSPDNTKEVLAPYAKDGTIRYIHQENRGQAFARNTGLKHSRGKYIAFLDDDDLWPVDALATHVRALDTDEQCVLSYGPAQYFTDLPDLHSPPPLFRYPSGWCLDNFLMQNWISSPGQTLIRRSALTAAGGLDSAIWGCDDYDLYIRLARLGTFNFNRNWSLFYRQHTGNASHRIGSLYRNAARVRRKHLGVIPTPSQFGIWYHNFFNTRCTYSDRFHRAAVESYKNGARRRALALFLRSVLLNPKKAFNGASFNGPAR